MAPLSPSPRLAGRPRRFDAMPLPRVVVHPSPRRRRPNRSTIANAASAPPLPTNAGEAPGLCPSLHAAAYSPSRAPTAARPRHQPRRAPLVRPRRPAPRALTSALVRGTAPPAPRSALLPFARAPRPPVAAPVAPATSRGRARSSAPLRLLHFLRRPAPLRPAVPRRRRTQPPPRGWPGPVPSQASTRAPVPAVARATYHWASAPWPYDIWGPPLERKKRELKIILIK
nr:vegetative cell wall protein gp1-like [Aegilops tauschii subsp. strangulata]